VNSFPTGLDDIDSFTCQVLGKFLGLGLGSFQIFRSPKPGFWEKMNGTGCTSKITQLEFEHHLPKAPFLGSSRLFSRMVSRKTINFMQNEAIYP